MFEIIEDCSPYYIRFKHDGMEKVFDYMKNILAHQSFTYVTTEYGTSRLEESKFKHCWLDEETIDDVLNLSIANLIKGFSLPFASVFTSDPGLYYRAHKDGKNIRFAINYILKVSDDKCVTSWYSDGVKYGYHYDESEHSREILDFDPSKHTPIKSTIFKEGECVLFNTDIFHDFSNANSDNTRHILTIRSRHSGDLYFEDVKKQLFNQD